MRETDSERGEGETQTGRGRKTLRAGERQRVSPDTLLRGLMVE